MRRSYKFVIWPTVKQAAALVSMLEDHRELYNAALEHRRTAGRRAGRVKTVAVKREGRRWYVILSCDNVPRQILPATGAVTGIDMGVAWFLTTSEGTHVANPRYFQASRDRLAAAQRVLARRDRGSGRRGKARDRVSQAEFRCLSCGYYAHADENAAQNILRAGLALQAAQAA